MHSTHSIHRSALMPRLVGIAALLAFAPLTYSQAPPDSDTREPSATQAPRGAQAPTQQQSATVSEEKIDQFAEAYVAVEGIQSQAAQQISSAADQEAANAVKVNAETEMIKAVERSGLKVEEFNEIVQAMTSDVELRNKVVSKIEQRRRG
jgi:hypothetical protein